MLINTDHINNVLVLIPDKHMGDLVLSLTAVKALKSFFREQNFYIVIDSAYIEIVELIEELENVVLYPRKMIYDHSFFKRLTLMFNFFKQLRMTSPDVAIDLQGCVASSTMSFLSGAPLRIGRSTAKHPYFYNRKIDPLRGKHKFYNYMNILSAIGVHSKDEVNSVKASVGHRTALESILLKEAVSTEKPIVCIHTCAGAVYKQWTEEGFADISNWLVSEGFQVIFIGSKGDLENYHNIKFPLKHRSHSLIGKLSLGELAALFEKSALFIGNDSGPMHLADAIGIPVVALFGSAREEEWGPLSKNSIALRGDERCQKCMGNNCEHDFKCVKTISSDNVKNAIEKLIKQKNERCKSYS